MIIFFPLNAFSFVRAFTPSSSSSPSSPSLITLMKALEETKARIIREQLARTQRRISELRIQDRRRFRKVKRTEKSSERTKTLSSSRVEARREALISSHRTEKKCRSIVLLSRFCYLLCVCLVIVLVFIFVCVFVAIRHGNKENQMDFKGKEWQDV